MLNDPITLHRYLYANVNPVMNVDPTGLFTLRQLAITSGVVGTLTGIGTYAVTGSVKQSVLAGVITGSFVYFSLASFAAAGSAAGSAAISNEAVLVSHLLRRAAVKIARGTPQVASNTFKTLSKTRQGKQLITQAHRAISANLVQHGHKVPPEVFNVWQKLAELLFKFL
jgi:hypothetical protein